MLRSGHNGISCHRSCSVQVHLEVLPPTLLNGSVILQKCLIQGLERIVAIWAWLINQQIIASFMLHMITYVANLGVCTFSQRNVLYKNGLPVDAYNVVVTILIFASIIHSVGPSTTIVGAKQILRLQQTCNS